MSAAQYSTYRYHPVGTRYLTGTYTLDAWHHPAGFRIVPTICIIQTSNHLFYVCGLLLRCEGFYKQGGGEDGDPRQRGSGRVSVGPG